MKQVENSFILTGFVAKDAEIRTFTNNDVARFPMAIGRKETKDTEEWTDKNGVKQNGIKFVAQKFYEAVEKPEKAEKPEPKTRAKKQKEAA